MEEGVRVSVTVSVGEAIYWVIATTVRAAIVLMFEKAELTMFCGWMSETSASTCGSASAAAATKQKRLNPNMPAPNTVRGPLYALTFTLLLTTFNHVG